MKDTILIPTDFSISSLNLVKRAITDHYPESVRLLLVFDCHLPDSATELYFLSRKSVIAAHSNDDFRETLNMLQNRYSNQIEELTIEPFFGYNAAAFQGLVRAHSVQETYVPEPTLLPEHKNLVPLVRYIHKLQIPSNEVSWEVQPSGSIHSILNLFSA